SGDDNEGGNESGSAVLDGLVDEAMKSHEAGPDIVGSLDGLPPSRPEHAKRHIVGNTKQNNNDEHGDQAQVIGDAKCVGSNGTNTSTGLPVNKILDEIAGHMNLQAHNGVSDSKDTGYDSDVAAQITGLRV